MNGGQKALKPADYRSLAEFRRLLRHFLVFSEDAARRAGLAPQQHQALLAIKGAEEGESPTVGDLAQWLAIKHNSAVGLVNRLVKAGYLARRVHQADRRRVTLALTAAGEQLLADLTTAHRDELRMITPSLQRLIAKLER
ncbi:MAG: MarR family winged helix-turn-helix transcriptional regulator [Rhizomicrobium sp.]